jgi:hypothetical protein
MTRRRAQTGQTVVELLVGMAVSSLVLGALVGLAFAVQGAFRHWDEPIQQAQVSENIAPLLASIQADGERYIASQSGAELVFCQPGGEGKVTYETVRGSMTVQRVSDNGTGATLPGTPTPTPATIVATGLASMPSYSIIPATSPSPSGAVSTTEVLVTVGNQVATAYAVYFRGPVGSCG